jgi:hypothetical protein
MLPAAKARTKRIGKRHDLDLAARIGWAEYARQRRKWRARSTGSKARKLT